MKKDADAVKRNIRLTLGRGLKSDLKRGAVFRPGLAVIVNPGFRNVGTTDPLLHLGDIGFVIEGIGGRRGAQGGCADPKSEQR